jgi:transcriptional regulator with XRE-family HTH domain
MSAQDALADALWQLLKQKELTPSQLAEQAGVEVGLVNDVLMGKQRSAEDLGQLAAGLGADGDEFLAAPERKALAEEVAEGDDLHALLGSGDIVDLRGLPEGVQQALRALVAALRYAQAD